jgi:hypothetical protein
MTFLGSLMPYPLGLSLTAPVGQALVTPWVKPALRGQRGPVAKSDLPVLLPAACHQDPQPGTTIQALLSLPAGSQPITHQGKWLPCLYAECSGRQEHNGRAGGQQGPGPSLPLGCLHTAALDSGQDFTLQSCEEPSPVWGGRGLASETHFMFRLLALRRPHGGFHCCVRASHTC